ncbi:MAG: hypothetical protein JJ964_15395 [Rhizobiales bacterium]|nr:hypothetical protein [Hyphomicrobiales bacterium]
MSMNQFKEKFIKNLTHEELITEYEAKFALCEHLEDEVQRLTRERSKLAEEVVSLEVKLKTSDDKLSEHEKGLTIEKADKKKKYHWHNGREWVVLFWNQGWKFKAVKVLPIAMNVIDDDLDRLYPLPSVTKEGS